MQIRVKAGFWCIDWLLHCPSPYIYILIYRNITKYDQDTKSKSKETHDFDTTQTLKNVYKEIDFYLILYSASITMVFSLTFFPLAHSLFHWQQPSSLFHRHTPCSIGCSLQVSSIGIGNSTLSLISNTSIRIHMPPPLKQPSLQAHFHPLSIFTVIFPLLINPSWPSCTCWKTMSTKTLRNLNSKHGIELGFFHGYRTIGLTQGDLNW
jgi:hypothetical protein